MEVPVGILAQCYDLGDVEYTERRLEASFGYEWGALCETSIFGPPLQRDRAVCPCPAGDHQAIITHRDKKGSYRARCPLPRGPSYKLPASEVEIHKFSADAFEKMVGKAIGIREWKNWDVFPDCCRYLGDAQLGTTIYPVFLLRAASSAETLSASVEISRKGIGKTGGLFLCLNMPPDALTAVNKHAFARFEDVFELDNGRLSKRAKVIREALGTSRIQKMKPAASAALLLILIDDFIDEHGKRPSISELIIYSENHWLEDQDPPKKAKCSQALNIHKARK